MCSNCIRLRRPQCSYPDGEVGYASIAESELRPLNHRNTSNPKKTGSAVGKNSNKRSENGLNISSSVFQDGIMGDIAMIPVESSDNTGTTNHADITAYDPSLLQQSASNGSAQGIPQTASALALDDKMSPTTIQTSLNSTFSSEPSIAVPPSPIPGAETILPFEQLQLQLPPQTYQPPALTELTTESLAESALRTLSSSNFHTNTKSLPLGTTTADTIESREVSHHTSHPHHASPHNIRPKLKSNADTDTDTDTSFLSSLPLPLSSLPVSSKAKIKSLSLEDIANYNTKLRILEFFRLPRVDTLSKHSLGEGVSGNNDNNNNDDKGNNGDNNGTNDTDNKKSKKSDDIRKKRDHNEKVRLAALTREMVFLKRRLDELNGKLASFDEGYITNNNNNSQSTDSNDSDDYWAYHQHENASLDDSGMKAIEKRRNMSRLIKERRKYISELLSGIPFKIATLDIQGDFKEASGLGTYFKRDALFTPESLFDKDPFIMEFITSVPLEKVDRENGENDADDIDTNDNNNNNDDDMMNPPFYGGDRKTLVFNWTKSTLRECLDYLFTKLAGLVEYLHPLTEEEIVNKYVDKLYEDTNEEHFSISVDPSEATCDLYTKLSKCGTVVLLVLLTYIVASDNYPSSPSFVSKLESSLSTVLKNLYIIKDILQPVRDPVILSQKNLRRQLAQFFILWKFYEECSPMTDNNCASGNKIDLCEDILMVNFNGDNPVAEQHGALVAVAQRGYVYRTLVIGKISPMVDPYEIVSDFSPRERDLIRLICKLLTYFHRQLGNQHQSSHSNAISIEGIAALLHKLKVKFEKQIPFAKRNTISSKMESFTYYSCSIFAYHFILLNLELVSPTPIVYSYILLTFLQEIASFLSNVEEFLVHPTSTLGTPNYNVLNLKRTGRLLESVSLMLYALYQRSNMQGVQSTESYNEKVKFHVALKETINNIQRVLLQHNNSTKYRHDILSGPSSRLRAIVDMIEREEDHGCPEILPNKSTSNFFGLTEGKLGECSGILNEVWRK